MSSRRASTSLATAASRASGTHPASAAASAKAAAAPSDDPFEFNGNDDQPTRAAGQQAPDATPKRRIPHSYQSPADVRRIENEARQLREMLSTPAGVQTLTGNKKARANTTTPSKASAAKKRPRDESDEDSSAADSDVEMLDAPPSRKKPASAAAAASAPASSASKKPVAKVSSSLKPRSIAAALITPLKKKQRRDSHESEEDEADGENGSDEDESDDDPKDDVCTHCSKPGKLIVCDKCVHAFHIHCCIRDRPENKKVLQGIEDKDFCCDDVHLQCTSRTTPIKARPVSQKAAIARSEAKIAADKARALKEKVGSQQLRPRGKSDGSTGSAKAAPAAAKPKKTIIDLVEAEASSAAADVQKEKDDVCHVCHDGGLLYVCDKCVHAFHVGCLEEHHEDNYDLLKELDDNDEMPLTCRLVHLDCTSRTKPYKVKDQEKKETNQAAAASATGKFKWGPRLQMHHAPAGRKFYKSFVQHDGTLYELGDFITLKNEEGGGPNGRYKDDFVAQIEELYEEVSSGLRYVECRWLYAPEETRSGRLESHGVDELFMTAHIDHNELDAIQDRCEVVSFAEYMERKANGEFDSQQNGPQGDQQRTFFIRQTYDDDRGIFRPWIAPPNFGGKKATSGALAALGSSAGGGRTKHALANSLLKAGPNGRQAKGSIYSRACASLQLSAAPARLPCREKEHTQIKSFIENALKRGQADGGLYIAGVPGTGKTATVVRVINELASRSDVPNFEYVEINGMKLPEPHQLYTAFWKQLTTKNASAAKAAVFLDQRFKTTNLRRPMCVLLVDELDYIMTRQQNVIYNLFDWPARKSARLIVIGISNTIDLPDLLMPRVHSRLGLTKIHFEPYTTVQIHKIIQDRLRSLEAFGEDAIELCARKIASVSGDIRRALQICRRAAEICEEDVIRAGLAAKKASDTGASSKGKKAAAASSAAAPAASAASSSHDGDGSSVPSHMIGENHIIRAINDLQNSNFIHYLTHSATPNDKILLSGMMSSIKYAAGVGGLVGNETNPAVPLATLVEHTERNMETRGTRAKLARAHGLTEKDLPKSTMADWMHVVQQWSDMRLVQLAYTRGERWPTVQLHMLTEDIEHAFRADEVWQQMRS